MADERSFLTQAMRIIENAPRMMTEAERAAERAREVELIDKALKGLRRNWRDADPGKYGTHWFFIRDFALKESEQSGWSGVHLLDWCDRFFARDFVDDLAAAERGIEIGSHGQKYDKPHPVPLGALADAAKEICLGCKDDGVLIGSYAQTYDSPDGDEWTITMFALCLRCPTLRPVAKVADEYRCSHKLAKPSR
jgi:hypothetical protein